MIPWDVKTVGMVDILTIPVCVGAESSVSPTSMGIQQIGITSGSLGPQEVRDAQTLDTSINGISGEHREPAQSFSNLISCKLSNGSRAYIYSLCRMNLTHDAVLTKSPNFVNLGLSSVHTSDELRSVFVPTTIIGNPTDGYNWLPPGYIVGKVTADRMIRTMSEKNYTAKNYYETRKENTYFGRQIVL